MRGISSDAKISAAINFNNKKVPQSGNFYLFSNEGAHRICARWNGNGKFAIQLREKRDEIQND